MGLAFFHYMHIDPPSGGMKEVHSEQHEYKPEFDKLELKLIQEVSDGCQTANYVLWHIDTIEREGKILERHFVLVRDWGFASGLGWIQ